MEPKLVVIAALGIAVVAAYMAGLELLSAAVGGGAAVVLAANTYRARSGK